MPSNEQGAGEKLPPGIVAVRRSMPRLLATMVRDPLGVIPRQAYEERMVLTRNAGRLRAYVSDPALIQEALVRNAASLTKSREMKRVLGELLGEGLLTADGGSWRWQRQALAPGFQPEALAGMTAAMVATAQAMVNGWLGRGGAVEVDVGRAMMRTTIAIILDTMLSGGDGMPGADIERAMGDALAATPWMFALAVLDAPRWLPFPGRRRAEAANRLMRATVRERIVARRRIRASGDDARRDLMATLLDARDAETGRAPDDEEVADNILTFVTAGHETTAVALTWALSLLADHPDCAFKLRDEIDAATGGGPLRPEHVGALSYARQVVSEAMRLYPPAPILARRVERPFALDGVTLPAGSLLFVPIHAVHRHAALWPEPERFDPGRFADGVKRHRFAFMPFGAGPRVCIGSGFALDEAVAILAAVAGHFTFERAGPAPPPQMRVTLRPRTPLRLWLVPR